VADGAGLPGDTAAFNGCPNVELFGLLSGVRLDY
jgi:hypothetical protein